MTDLIKPRVTETDFNGSPGVLLDLPGHKGRGIFVPAPHLDAVLDELDAIAYRDQP
ncbi:hypothetical protein ABZ546_01490 [Brachybacterium paraconglomeratum]